MKLISMLLVAVLVSFFLFALQVIPLGIPGEWAWPRQDIPSDVSEWADRFLVPLLTAIAAIGFCRFGDSRIDRLSLMNRSALLVGLVGVAFLWQKSVVGTAESPHRELRPLWVLYDRYASGYFYKAVFDPTPVSELLASYEATMAKGDVLHEGTHPPGLLLLNRLALHATKRWPSVAASSQMTISSDSLQAFQQLEKQAALARPLSPAELSALCLTATLSAFFAAFTVVPVYLLVARLGTRQMAWRAACLSMSAPGIAVFLPRSDVVYACSGAWLLLLIGLSVTTRSRMAAGVWAAVGGFMLFACLLVSLVHLPVLVAGVGFAVLMWLTSRHLGSDANFWQLLFIAVIAAIAFFSLVFLFERLTSCNMFIVWRQNLSNHEGFYGTSVRTWWKWAIVNPIELAFTAGLPLALMAICHLTYISSTFRSKHFNSPRLRLQLLSVAMFMTWGCLWLSGKNMGEAARLWCFITPWVCITAAAGLDLLCDVSHADQPTFNARKRRANAVWLVLLGSQFVVCALTNGLVSGFLEL